MAQVQLERLLDQARQNEIKMRRFQSMELRLLEAESLTELCRLMVEEYPRVFQIDVAALHLFDPERELMRLDHSRDLLKLRSVYVHHSLNNRIQPLGGSRPRLSPFDPISHRELFPSQLQPLQSICLLPLRRRDQLLALFALGSRDAARFNGGSTDLLQRLSAIAATCVDNALNLERLRQAGIRDPLTGLYNRRHFDDALRREILVAQRQCKPLACLYMDVDHFKQINDCHGHPVGDQVLQGVAYALRRQQRRSEILARIGGEEFALLLPDTTLDEAAAAAERIRARIETIGVLDGGELSVTISCGVATLCPQHQQDPETAASGLLVAADTALLRAKAMGRNRVIQADNAEPPCAAEPRRAVPPAR